MRSPINKLLDSLEIAPKRILDVGSGEGRTTVQLQRRFPNSQIISFDFMEDLCKYVKEHINEHVICADATSLPLKDESFDLVACDQVIEHIENQNELVEELYRILAEEGYIICGSVLRKRFALAFYRSNKGELVLSPDHVREYRSKQEFAEPFNNDFNILEIHVSQFPMALLIDIYHLLAKILPLKFIKNFERRHLDFKLPGSLARRLMEVIFIPRPGYRIIYLIAKKKTAT